MLPKRLYIIVISSIFTVGCFLFFSTETYGERQKLFTRETSKVVLHENLNKNELQSLYEEENVDIGLQEEKSLLEKTEESVPAVSDIEKQEKILPTAPTITSLEGAKESVPVVSDADKQEKSLPTAPEKPPLIGTKVSIPAVSDVEKQENGLPEVPEKTPIEATRESVKGTLNKKSESKSLSLPVEKDYSRSKQAQEKRKAR